MKETKEEVVAVIGATQQAEGEAELTRTVTEIELHAQSIIIANADDYQQAADFGRALKQKSAEVTAFFAPMKKAAHDAHKQVCDREKQMLAPLVNAEKVIKKTMGDWAMEQERIRKEEEERLRKAAEAESDRLFQQALEADRNGDVAARDAALMDAQVIEQAGRNLAIPGESTKANGVSVSKDWEITGVASDKVPVTFSGIELRPVDTAAVLRLIRASKGQIEIPGISYKEAAKMSFRK